MKVIRVFPRRTKATPIDSMARIGQSGLFDQVDEIHVSVAFSWDLPLAESLARDWSSVAPVKIGGPATGESGGDFEPGKYLKRGYVITSRGCPNRCWFCSVWKREGPTRELPITDGWNVLDDNLLACSDNHIRSVFSMLSRQNRRPEFTGGLEAARLQEWQAIELKRLKAKQVFFAYDTMDDFLPLKRAAEMMLGVGFTKESHSLRCYVLCGYKGDSVDKAGARMLSVVSLGLTPMAMLYRDQGGKKDPAFMSFQRNWARPAIIHSENMEGANLWVS